MTLSRVMPGRIVPRSSGVATRRSKSKKMFICPTSST